MTATDLVKFSPSDAAISLLADQYMGLKIAGIEDKEGFEQVHEARMVVKGHRVDVEKRRKLLKADALEYGRRVDGEAKRLTALLQPIEEHLQAEEQRVLDEKEAIRNAARLKAEAEERARKEAEEAAERAKREAEQAAIREEQRKLDEERKKLQAERESIEAEQRKQREEAEAKQRAAEEKLADERAIVEAEKQRLADEETARQRKIEAERRAIEMEKARADAAEQARIETEKRLKREAAEKAERERKREAAAEAKRLRAEALRPDKAKLMDVCTYLEIVTIPEVSDAARETASQISSVVAHAAEDVRALIEELE